MDDAYRQLLRQLPSVDELLYTFPAGPKRIKCLDRCY